MREVSADHWPVLCYIWFMDDCLLFRVNEFCIKVRMVKMNLSQTCGSYKSILLTGHAMRAI